MLLWFGHGCSGSRMHSEHKRYYRLGMNALVTVCSGNTNVIILWFEHGCSGYRMHSEHELYCGLGMDESTNAIMVWAWMLWDRMLWEHKRYYGSRMDALVIGRTRNTSVIILAPPPPPPKQSSETSQNRVRKSPRLQKQQ